MEKLSETKYFSIGQRVPQIWIKMKKNVKICTKNLNWTLLEANLFRAGQKVLQIYIKMTQKHEKSNGIINFSRFVIKTNSGNFLKKKN